MTTASVVGVALGLRLGQRGAPAGAASDLRVVDVAPLQLPETSAFEAYNVDHDLWRRSWSLPDRLVIEFLGVAAVEVRDDGTATVPGATPPPP